VGGSEQVILLEQRIRLGVDELEVFPEEWAMSVRMRQARAQEFLTARHLAHRAASLIGLPPRPILRRADGAPVWPEDRAGSITHTQSYIAVMLGHAGSIGAIGFDAEANVPLGAKVRELLLHETELKHIEALYATRSEIAWDTVIHSAKETVFKLDSSRSRGWLDPHDVSVMLLPAVSAFCATFRGRDVYGTMSLSRSLIRTWIVDDDRDSGR
jgi:4'-phosphopantetheinyl transferase EntD